MTVFDLIYGLARNSIVHEGKDHPNLIWSHDGSLRIVANGSKDHSSLIPKEYLVGMALAVITAPENASLYDLRSTCQVRTTGLGERWFEVSQLWGKEDYMYAEISAQRGYTVGRWTEREELEFKSLVPKLKYICVKGSAPCAAIR